MNASFRTLICVCFVLFSGIAYANEQADIDYDVVYVRYPGTADDEYIRISQGESPYPTIGGADLMLWRHDGPEEM